MKNHFNIGEYPVGSEHRPIFFAEIGSFFNGDARLAHLLLERIIAVRESRPDLPMVLKTEILNNPEICLPGDTIETYSSKSGQVKKENYRQLIERKSMSIEKYVPLFDRLVNVSMPFIVSVYDFEAVDFSVKYGASGLKIASANIVHIPLIRYAAGFGLPLVIDTGRASLAEVFRAVHTARVAGCENIVIQHSPDGHPAEPESHNLRILQSYQQCFNLPTGLSDHHIGLEMMYLSVALGASVIEKGIYTNPNELDQDISHSMHIDDLQMVLERINECWLALGKSERDPNDEIKGVIGTSQRQCLVAKKDLYPGDKICLENVRFAFPCRGIPVEEWDSVRDWQLSESISANQPIMWKNISQIYVS